MLEVLQVIKEQQISHGQIQFVITVGEESGLIGAKELNSELLDADFGYAIDASADVGTTVVGAPTQMLISAKIIGKRLMQVRQKRVLVLLILRRKQLVE